jgi:hypothetical protein
MICFTYPAIPYFQESLDLIPELTWFGVSEFRFFLAEVRKDGNTSSTMTIVHGAILCVVCVKPEFWTPSGEGNKKNQFLH